MTERIICIIIGYFIGAIIQTGYWIGRFSHIDIRNYGSGNAGTTNVMRNLGKKAGLLTYAFDMLKVVFSDVIIHFLFGNNLGNEMLLFLYSGFGVVLGHNFPFYLKFKGGKGIAASSGVIISLLVFPKHCWLFTIVGMIMFGSVTYLSKYVSVGSLTALTVWFLQFCLWIVIGWLPLSTSDAIEGCVLVFIITALGFIRHRSNLVRLANGTERKIGQKKE